MYGTGSIIKKLIVFELVHKFPAIMEFEGFIAMFIAPGN
jgi:hypothetical protein